MTTYQNALYQAFMNLPLPKRIGIVAGLGALVVSIVACGTPISSSTLSGTQAQTYLYQKCGDNAPTISHKNIWYDVVENEYPFGLGRNVEWAPSGTTTHGDVGRCNLK